MAGRLIVLLALISALALAACGGDDGGGDDGGASGAFVDAANEVCREGDERVEAIPEPQTLEEAAEATRQVQQIVDEAVEELSEAELPADGEERENAEAYIESLRDTSDQIDGVIEAAESGDEQAYVQAAEEVQEITEEGDRIARDLGADECGDDEDEQPIGEDTTETDAAGGDAEEGDCVGSWNASAPDQLKQVLTLSHAEGNPVQVGPYAGEAFSAEIFDTSTEGTGEQAEVSAGDCVLTEVSDGTVLSVFVRAEGAWHRLSESDPENPLSQGPDGLVEPVGQAQVGDDGELTGG